MFEFDFSDDFRKVFEKLSKREPVIARAVNRKVKEIIARDEKAYKNLSHDMGHLKRVHITEWFVLTFEVRLSESFILLVGIAPRDEVYKR